MKIYPNPKVHECAIQISIKINILGKPKPKSKPNSGFNIRLDDRPHEKTAFHPEGGIKACR
ncbi:MAG: hypothetical protein ACOC4M_17470 [Promethearchaeia archaeon]